MELEEKGLMGKGWGWVINGKQKGKGCVCGGGDDGGLKKDL